MKCLYTLALTILCATIISAQSTSTKRFAKTHDNKKYVITENVFEDGHKEQYITSVPVAESRKMKASSPFGNLKNMDWDEDLSEDGIQKSVASSLAIENAFNNALERTAVQLNLGAEGFKKIELDANFLTRNDHEQSLQLVNKIIEAFASSDKFSKLIPIEAVDDKINQDSERLAIKLLVEGKSGEQTCATTIGYRNIEFSEHVKNDGIFLTNGDDEISYPHIQAIYNWVFADAYTGWYNRDLLLNSHRDGGAKGLNDDYNESGKEGLIGIGIASGDFIDSIILDPTFKKATSVVFQLVDPLQSSKYNFDIQEMSTSLETGIAARK